MNINVRIISNIVKINVQNVEKVFTLNMNVTHNKDLDQILIPEKI